MSTIQEFTFFFNPDAYPRREARIYSNEDKFFWEIIGTEIITFSGEVIGGHYTGSGSADNITQAFQELYNCMRINIDRNIDNVDFSLIKIQNHNFPLISVDEQITLINNESIQIC
jgi:hypothetical protein